jgi:hypothetical protein
MKMQLLVMRIDEHAFGVCVRLVKVIEEERA